MDFNQEVADTLMLLLQRCGYDVREIRIREGAAARSAEVAYRSGGGRLVNISMDSALAACYDIITAVGHFC